MLNPTRDKLKSEMKACFYRGGERKTSVSRAGEYEGNTFHYNG